MIRLALMTAVAVTLVSADQIDNKVDVGATVKEVEAMLAKDPRLPRLTRGEILKLIDEVRTGKDVVVVLPDNQSPFNENAQSTTSKPRRPVKRRRKKPTVSPVYVHTTTSDSGGISSTETSTKRATESVTATSTTEAPESVMGSSTTQQANWKPFSTTRSPVSIVPVTPTPDSKLSGGLPPVPGLSLVENINSWSASTKNVYITPVPPVSSSTSAPQSAGGLESPPNMKVAAESLGPEMKDLLTKFGLLGGDSTTEKLTFQSDLIAPTIDPEVYSRFKPLPVKSSADFVSPDMKSLLASYGLLDTRQGKDLKAESSQDGNTPLDYIPEREKSILSSLGLWRDGKAIDLTGSLKNVADAGVLPKHVFKPKKMDPSSSKEELEKVTKILAKIKEIGEGNESEMTELSPSEVEELLLLENNTRLAALDELDLSEDSESEEKNEVKRNPQESSASASASASSSAGASSSSSASASSSSSTSDSSSSVDAAASADGDGDSQATTEATTTTESSSSDDTTERGASAVDLEDSFGGGAISTTTKRPNGFYFLLDWNSFLDLGLDDRAIHLNFSPKVGNPANFLPVEIGKSGTPGSR